MATAVVPPRSIPAPVPESAHERVAYIDRLKVLLIATIIAGHAILGYTSLEDVWPYQSVQEVQLSQVADALVATLVLPPVLFTMGLFFLIAGLLSPRSLARKGTRRYVHDRLLRLGVPFAVWTLALWPLVKWSAYRLAGDPALFWRQYLHGDPAFDTGPLWFVGSLLLYSLGFAAWRSGHPVGDRTPLTGRTLYLLAAAVSLATLVLRPAFPLADGEPFQIHMWQLPQFVGLFGLGIVAAERGWLNPVSARIRHQSGVMALAGLAATGALMGALMATGYEPDVFFDTGFHWPSLLLALVEGPLAVGTCVWILGVAQRKLDAPLSDLDRKLARSAFAAFILQAIVLLALALAMRPVPVPAEVKGLVVAAAGVVSCFWLGWLLVTRTRLGRIL